jgi:hypothetical protein
VLGEPTRAASVTAVPGATGLSAMSVLFLFVASYDKVEEYEVGIPISFGNAQARVGPGIESQAQGGGSLNLDLRVQWRIPVDGAVDIYRNVGTDKSQIESVVIVPAVRECPATSRSTTHPKVHLRTIVKRSETGLWTAFGPRLPRSVSRSPTFSSVRSLPARHPMPAWPRKRFLRSSRTSDAQCHLDLSVGFRGRDELVEQGEACAY